MLSMWLMICSVRCAQYSTLKREARVEGDGSEARRPANQVSKALDQLAQPTELGSNWWRSTQGSNRSKSKRPRLLASSVTGGIRGPIKCGIFQAVAVKTCCRSEVARGCCGRKGMFPGVLNVVLDVGMRVTPAA